VSDRDGAFSMGTRLLVGHRCRAGRSQGQMLPLLVAVSWVLARAQHRWRIKAGRSCWLRSLCPGQMEGLGGSRSPSRPAGTRMEHRQRRDVLPRCHPLRQPRRNWARSSDPSGHRRGLHDISRRQGSPETASQSRRAGEDPAHRSGSVSAFLGPADVQLVSISKPEATHGDRRPPAARQSAFVSSRQQRGRGQNCRHDPADHDGRPGSARRAQSHRHWTIEHAGVLVGALSIGTSDETSARTLVESTPIVFSASAGSTAPWRTTARDVSGGSTARGAHGDLEMGSFHPVYQPIVDLESREVVGYEALTRFDSGQRPDLCFADAWSVGLGPISR